MNTEFLQEILYTITAAAVPVITVYFCRFLKTLYEGKRTEVKNENAKAVLDRVVNMIIAAVETTTSTYVKQLKAQNLFDVEAQKEAFKKTYDAIQKQLTEESIEIIKTSYGDVETFITNKIEQYVEELKK